MKISVKRGRETVHSYSTTRTEETKKKEVKGPSIKVSISGLEPTPTHIPDNFSIRDTILNGNNIHAAQNRNLQREKKEYETASNFIPASLVDQTTRSIIKPDKDEEVIVKKDELLSTEFAGEVSVNDEEAKEIIDEVIDEDDNIINRYEEEYGEHQAGFERIKKRNVLDEY